MQPVIQYISHPYVSTWFLSVFLFGYLLVYLTARIAASSLVGSGQLSVRGLIERGYKSWSLPIFLHLIVILGVFGILIWKIWEQRRLSVDWMFLVPMAMILVADCIVLWSLRKKQRRILGRLG